jgi:hypothetical protein
MWSSWVKRKGITPVMYIAKLKDGPKKAKKTFSMILKKGFWNGRMEGRKWNHIKRLFEVEMFFSSQNIDFTFYLRRLLKLFFSFFFLFSFFLFFYSPSLEDLGFFLWYLRRKSLLQKPLFKWHDMEWHGHDYGYTGGGHIFQNGVMHANIAKPWLWRCGSCGYIGGGHIFRSGGMHANISGWG